MYEVGIWFVYLLDFAVLAIFGMVALILIFVKRNQYQKDATNKIRAEIWLSTGWSEYFVIPCEQNDKSVTIDNFIYLLDQNKRRFGKHPMNPFMGLSWLQVPIRIETWDKDQPNPIRGLKDEKSVATAAEIKAMTREIQATTAAMQIQEIDAQQKELVNAISNQPNKMIVYVLLVACALASIAGIFVAYSLLTNISIMLENGGF